MFKFVNVNKERSRQAARRGVENKRFGSTLTGLGVNVEVDDGAAIEKDVRGSPVHRTSFVVRFEVKHTTLDNDNGGVTADGRGRSKCQNLEHLRQDFRVLGRCR